MVHAWGIWRRKMVQKVVKMLHISRLMINYT
jgi:hypothetical protein